MDHDDAQPISPELDVTRLSTPRLIDHLCDQFKAYVTPLLNTAFNKADDSLFDQADRSTSNTQQQAYFETMRAVRVSRSDIIAHFFNLFKQGWRAVKAPPLLTGKVSFDELSLLRKDELEELVANEAMITRIKDHAGEHLSFLIERCQTLNKHLDEDEVPFHPKFLCQSFSNALTKVELDINSKLIVLKHFDRHVIANLTECFIELNHILIQANVLPELKSKKPQKQSRQSGQYGSSPHDGSEPFDASNPIQSFEALRNLFYQSSQGPALQGTAQTPSQGPTQTGQTGAGSLFNDTAFLPPFIQTAARNGNSQNSGQPTGVIASQELADTLGQLQTQFTQQNGVEVSTDTLKAALQAKLENKTLNQVDNDALNLVSMLFEFILDDPQLSVHMKELFGRLQIPMLKVAVLDNSFFANKKNPARVLLNGLARAGQAWNPSETLADDKYFQIVAKIVRKVVEDFTDDFALFDQLNQTLSKLLDHQKQQQAKREQAIKQKEEENARQELARQQALATVDALCDAQPTPAFLRQFLRHNWVTIFETSLMQNDQAMFEHASQLAETLIWSTNPSEISEDRKAFVRQVPPLLADLRQLAKAFHFAQTDMDALMENLEPIHLNFARSSGEKDHHNTDQSQITNTHTEGEQETVHGFAADNVIPLKTKTEQAKNTQAQNDETQNAETNREPARVDSRFYRELDAFEVGMLFEFTLPKEDESGSEKQRKNLTAMIRSTEKYIFMDRHGGGRLEMYRDELASALADKLVVHLDDSLLFDRALEAVIGSLRKNQTA